MMTVAEKRRSGAHRKIPGQKENEENERSFFIRLPPSIEREREARISCVSVTHWASTGGAGLFS